MLSLSVLGGASVATGFVLSRGRELKPATTLAIPRFEIPLKIPPVLDATTQTEAQDEYDIVQRESEQEIVRGHATKIWGYQGSYPGPTIRVRRNRTAVVRHTNRLATHTVVHLHGGVTPAASDGFATDMVAPGETRAYTYPNRQRACTLWYHDHAMGRTGENIFRGLAGFYFVEDDEELALALPSGSFDVPLLLQDRGFNADGSFRYDTNGHQGFQGDVMLVNGVPWPKMDVSTRKYRFRLLNGSNARPFELALSNGDPLTLIATDGGLVPEPVPVKKLPLSMAERAEVVVDFSRFAIGTKIFLVNARDNKGLSQLMRFDVVKRELDDARVPSHLSHPGFLAHPKTSNNENVVSPGKCESSRRTSAYCVDYQR